MKPVRSILVFALLLTGVFTGGTLLQPRASQWAGRSQSDTVLKVLLGDSRRMFANHFFVKADIAFHSGYYPSIFEQAAMTERMENALANEGQHDDHEGHDHEGHDHSEHAGSGGGHGDESAGFRSKPTDWIDRFGRRFRIDEHTHLENRDLAEILPWLRVSADLDPNRVETYTTAAYWLRKHLDKPVEAEEFLREGLRANPSSYEILFELGRLYYENRKDSERAKNIWQLALRRWKERNQGQVQPDTKTAHAILLDLAKVEEDAGNYAKAVEWMLQAKPFSPNPEVLQERINAVRAKVGSPSSRPPDGERP